MFAIIATPGLGQGVEARSAAEIDYLVANGKVAVIERFESPVTAHGTVIWGVDNSFAADLVLTGVGTGALRCTSQEVGKHRVPSGTSR
jgi:hypothetical protein